MPRLVLILLASSLLVFSAAAPSAAELSSTAAPGPEASTRARERPPCLDGPASAVVDDVETAAPRTDPNTTRLLLGPTARSLRRGEIYFDLFSLTIPFVQVGLTDRFSIGAGAPVLIPGVVPGEVFFVTPKLQLFAGGKTAVAVGVLHIHDGPGNRTGIAYGIVTRGTPDAALTAGLGYGYWRSKSTNARTPVVLLGGEKRVSPSVKLITENYVTRGGGLVAVGLRLIRDRVTWDLGLGADLGGGVMVAWPVVRFSWRFPAG
jgi:hypothetical protein